MNTYPHRHRRRDHPVHRRHILRAEEVRLRQQIFAQRPVLAAETPREYCGRLRRGCNRLMMVHRLLHCQKGARSRLKDPSPADRPAQMGISPIRHLSIR